MWRSLFLGVGLSTCLLGAECLLIDKAVLAEKKSSTDSKFLGINTSGPVKREFTPPDWAPWSLLSAGAITILYSFTIPNRAKD